MILKCKMCGGDLDIQPGKKIAECMYCGSMQTVPNIDDERRANLFARAGQFRLNGEFDKAMAVYDEILREDTTDAEAHWSMVLCKYGIDYVQDPKTRRRVPTVNRMQYTSVFEDADYIETIKYADASQKEVYEIEANAIENIRNGILEISKKEKPFDIFISYKETDGQGRRTEDSVYAYDIYEKLTAEGYRVFFSRVTLESVVGTAYEPYIFAALNSAKVMLVVGTSAENMNSVWVRNEWSRYLLLMQQDKSKSLIPIYKDMNPYDLPAEFSYLQAQDANRIGFMQDLVRGIDKLLGKRTEATTTEDATSVSLLKRAYMYLDDQEWSAADKYFERALDADPECGEAYLGKILAMNYCMYISQLGSVSIPFDNSDIYLKFLKFGDVDAVSQVKKELEKVYEKANAEEQRTLLASQIMHKKIRNVAILISLFIIILCSVYYVIFVLAPKKKYDAAIDLYNSGKYEEAMMLFSELEDYADTGFFVDQIKDRKEAISAFNDKDYIKVRDIIPKNCNDEQLLELRKLATIELADTYTNEKKYDSALKLLDEVEDDLRASDLFNQIYYAKAQIAGGQGDLELAAELLKKVDDSYQDTKEIISLIDKYSCDTGVWKLGAKIVVVSVKLDFSSKEAKYCLDKDGLHDYQKTSTLLGGERSRSYELEGREFVNRDSTDNVEYYRFNIDTGELRYKYKADENFAPKENYFILTKQ